MNQLWKSVQQLDLKSVKTKFAAKKGWWWNLSHSSGQIEKEYRQFFYLSAGREFKSVIPWSKEVDDFWLEHSLEGKKYEHDCEAILGRQMPYRMRVIHGSKSHAESLAQTRLLYLNTFGETARKERRRAGEYDFGGDSWPQVFSDHDHHVGHHHHSGHHGWGHHGGHADAGHTGGGHHAGADHGGGGHTGHSCGGHSGCGGHGGH